MDDSIFSEIIDLKSAHEIWIYLNEKYGVVSNDDDDEPMLEVHEDVQHSHISVIVEDCSTSWSSVDDDHTTTRSLDKIDVDGPSSSDVIDVSTASTLDDDDSCSSYEVMSLQAILHHHIASYHMVTQRYQLVTWLLIVMIQILSLYVDSPIF
jgi:hypothetical protein